MASNVSPGVYTRLIDLSSYLEDIPGSVGFIPFLSRRGPDNVLTYVTGLQDFADKYNKPNINDYGKSYGQGTYIAWNHIKVSPSLYCMRALPADATYSNLFINFDSDPGQDPRFTVTHETSANTVSELDTALAAQSGNVFPLMYFYPEGRGDSYNDFAITIAAHANTNLDDIYVIDIWETQADGDDVIIESFEVSFEKDIVDDSGDSLWIEDVINKFSKWVKVVVNEDHLNTWVGDPVEIAIGDSTSPIHLDGGSEGSLVTVDGTTGRRVVDSTTADAALSAAYTGTSVNPVNGIAEGSVLDVDDIYFSLVYDGGYPSNVKSSIHTLVNDLRLDCVAIVDNNDNTTAAATLTARNDTHTWDSKYMSIFEPYSKVNDIHTGRDIWFSPVFHMANMIPLNDRLYEIWYPNAGFNRASISDIKELRYNANLSQRDSLHLKQINPIVKFSTGYTVWGNKTTQKKPSSLQDLHIIRLVMYIKRALEQYLKFYTFEFNDAETWNAVENAIRPFLEDIKKSRGLESFNISVGSTEYEKKRKIIHVDVELVPTKAIERIELNLYIK